MDRDKYESINRNIVECKVLKDQGYKTAVAVLIET